ncbi:MAG TPA: cytochrome P460 family protein [Pyrinomonadaceae bacterium]
MTKNIAKFLTILALTTVLAACASLSADEVATHIAPAGSVHASGSELIEGYRQWTRLNPEPAFQPSRVAIQCAAPTAEQIQLDKTNPHQNKFITVYVNDIGKNAMTTQLNPVFPQGSVIVKEKLPAKDSTSPELLTVMIKRESGYNPENGDWEYMAVDGAGKVVQARGKLANCQACHITRKDTGYVYRDYLPSDVSQKLK